MGLSTVDAPAGGGACQNSVTCAAMCRCVIFSSGPEIGACGHMGRYFPTRLPLEGRSEGGTLVGVLFGRNGGYRKKLLATRCFDDGLTYVRLCEDCNMTRV